MHVPLQTPCAQRILAVLKPILAVLMALFDCLCGSVLEVYLDVCGIGWLGVLIGLVCVC